jgi:hypothetical protein
MWFRMSTVPQSLFSIVLLVLGESHLEGSWKKVEIFMLLLMGTSIIDISVQQAIHPIFMIPLTSYLNLRLMTLGIIFIGVTSLHQNCMHHLYPMRPLTYARIHMKPLMERSKKQPWIASMTQESWH